MSALKTFQYQEQSYYIYKAKRGFYKDRFGKVIYLPDVITKQVKVYDIDNIETIRFTRPRPGMREDTFRPEIIDTDFHWEERDLIVISNHDWDVRVEMEIAHLLNIREFAVKNKWEKSTLIRKDKEFRVIGEYLLSLQFIREDDAIHVYKNQLKHR